MTDIPLDTSPITAQFMLEKRRPDGTRPSWKDMPRAWAWDVPAPAEPRHDAEPRHVAVPREKLREPEAASEAGVADGPASE
jgi:hypothetical protein